MADPFVDEIKEPKDVIQRIVAVAMVMDDEDLVTTLGNEFPAEFLRQGFITACLLFGAMADLAAKHMEKGDGSPVMPQDVMGAIAMKAEDWF